MALRHYQASTTVETQLAYECEACGYEGMADVVGEGYVETDAPTAQENDAAARALDAAERRAWNDALSTVDLAPCPRCGATSPDRWRRWRRAQLPEALWWGAVGALVGAVGAFLLRQRFDALPPLVAALVGPLVALAVVATRTRRKRIRAASVRFDPLARPQDDDAGL